MKPFHVAFCVVPEFALTSLAVGLDALRVANRMAGRAAFRWSVLSPDGGRIRANCGLPIGVDGRFPADHHAVRGLDDIDMVLVVAGFDPQKYCYPALLRWLAALRRRRRVVGAIASGAYVLAAAGLLDGIACTIHWENRTMLAERFPHVDIRPQLYVVDRGICTCGGSSSVFDMMLHVIAEHAGAAVAARVAEQSLLSTIRPPDVAVHRPFGAQTLAPGSLVVRALARMESRLSEPDPIGAIAGELGVSLRALERQFKAELGEPPSRYYRRLRVEHAARLVQQTEMSLTDIGVACGFASRAHFSRSYRAVLGRTPSADRDRFRRRSAGRPSDRRYGRT